MLQRQEQTPSHALLGEGAVHELTAAQFTNQASITLCGEVRQGPGCKGSRAESVPENMTPERRAEIAK